MFNLFTRPSYLGYRFNLFRGGGDLCGHVQLHGGIAKQLFNFQIRDARHIVEGLCEKVIEALVEVLVLLNRERGGEGRGKRSGGGGGRSRH